MNTFWLKVAGGVLGLFIVLIVGAHFMGPGEPARKVVADVPAAEPAPKEKTFYDQVEEDRERFATPPVAAPADTSPAPTPTPAPTAAPEPETQPRVIYVKPLDEIESIEAQRQLEVAVPGRSIGRLPMTGYSLAVQTCKRTIERWPESVYAFQAKQILISLPERFRERYHLTPALLDVRPFFRPRPGTQAVQLAPAD